MKQEHQVNNSKVIKVALLILGIFFLLLGIIGIIVPGMPTTIFILLAGWCWAKSSDKFYNWLINHKMFGHMIKNWQEKKSMPKKAKYLAWLMMGVSCMILFYRFHNTMLWLPLLVSIICFSVAVWMFKLPDS